MENSKDFDNWSQQNTLESGKYKCSYFDSVIITFNAAFNEMAITHTDPSVKKLYFDTDGCAFSKDICVNDFAPPGVCRRFMLNLVICQAEKHHIRTKKDSCSGVNLLPLNVYLQLFPRTTHKQLDHSVCQSVSLYALHVFYKRL